MGKEFHWFKDLEVEIESSTAKVSFIDGGEYGFSYTNAFILECIIGQFGLDIAHIDSIYYPDYFEKDRLPSREGFLSHIPTPDTMLQNIDNILSNKKRYIKPFIIDNDAERYNDMIEYLQWFKTLCEQGYYISFEHD